MSIWAGWSDRLFHAVRAWQGASLALVALAAVLLFAFVDLEPDVGKEFFFASDDPQLREDQEIERTFPEQPQLIISAAAEDVGAAGYVQKLARLSAELQQVEGVLNVRDILHGPDDVEDAFEHPLWRRLLVAEDGSVHPARRTLDVPLRDAMSANLRSRRCVERREARGPRPFLRRQAGRAVGTRARLSGFPYGAER